MRNLLYYPYINLPNAAWTARALMYYDDVAAIVPHDYFNDPDQYHPFMRKLVQDRLVIPIDPMSVLTKPWKVAEHFMEYTESKEFNLKERRSRFRKNHAKINEQKLTGRNAAIHFEKFDREIFQYLVKQGLASHEGGNWYNVEKRTANDLMTFLATIIGKKLKIQPATDKMRKKHSSSILRSKRKTKGRKTQEKKRQFILEQIIPLPEQINLTRLRSFKDDHHKQLEAFQTRIELIVLDPTMEEGSARFKEAVTELRQRQEELSAKMNEANLGRTILGSFGSVVSSAVTLAIANTSPEIIAAVGGFVSSIYSALESESVTEVFDQTGLKYIALLDNKLRKPASPLLSSFDLNHLNG